MNCTEENFNKLLASFKDGGNDETRIRSVDLVISGNLWTSKDYVLIPDYMKKSLARKVARYIAVTALKGVRAIDKLAEDTNFHEYENGHLKSFSTYVDGVFTPLQ